MYGRNGKGASPPSRAAYDKPRRQAIHAPRFHPPHSLKAPTGLTDDLNRAAFELFDRWARSGFRPVRLIGMSAGRFTHGEGQLDLFPDPARERKRRLDATVDEIRRRHGDASIGRSSAT